MLYQKFKVQIPHKNISCLFFANLVKSFQKSIMQTIINILQNNIAHNYAAIHINYAGANEIPACGVHSPPKKFGIFSFWRIRIIIQRGQINNFIK